MERELSTARGPRFWIILAGIVIALIFLYYYQPFEDYVVEGITHIRSDNVVFWFASLAGVVGYAIAHWQTFRRMILRASGELAAEDLVFETLQIAILIALIFCTGATLQAIVNLGAHLMLAEGILNAAFGSRLFTIILLVLLVIAFYLLHHVVRAFRGGWRPKRPPGRGAASRGPAE